MSTSHRTRAPRRGDTEHERIIADCAAGRLRGFARSAAIVHLLKLRGLSLRSLSVAEKLNDRAGSNTLRTPWPRMEKVIADALGTEARLLWPERYVDGAPMHVGRKAS